MASRYLLESGAPDGYQLEDGSGVLILESEAAVTPSLLASLGVGCWIAALACYRWMTLLLLGVS